MGQWHSCRQTAQMTTDTATTESNICDTFLVQHLSSAVNSSHLVHLKRSAKPQGLTVTLDITAVCPKKTSRWNADADIPTVAREKNLRIASCCAHNDMKVFVKTVKMLTYITTTLDMETLDTGCNMKLAAVVANKQQFCSS